MAAPHFEVVQTDAGYHLRLRGDNGEPIASTEVYTRPGAAYDALVNITEAVDAMRAGRGVEVRDERTDKPGAPA